MDANSELNAAVDRRIQREMAFKEEIISQINAIISELAFCDPTNAASTLNLSQGELRDVIEKLNNIDIIGPGESARISDSLKTKNLRRVPEVATPSPNPAAPGTIPTPLTVGRRPNPPAASAPAIPTVSGLTMRERGANWANRVKNGMEGLKNTNPTLPPAIPQTPRIGGRRTRKRKGKSKRIV